MSWKLSRTVLRGGVIGNGGSLLGFGKEGSKQPYYFHLPSGEPMAFAGLYEIWEDKEAPPEVGPYKSCTIITTQASASVKDIHNRMPLILKPDAYEEWLDPSNKEPAVRTAFGTEKTDVIPGDAPLNVDEKLGSTLVAGGLSNNFSPFL